MGDVRWQALANATVALCRIGRQTCMPDSLRGHGKGQMTFSAITDTPAMLSDTVLFTGNANPALSQEIATHLGISLGQAAVGRFSDGETTVEIQQNVRGREVFVVQSTCAPTNDNLMELLIMVDALKRASAQRITAVIPYFGYARQDRKDQPRVAITSKLIANLIATAGADRVISMDLHAPQLQGFFDIPVDHLYASNTFVKHFLERAMSDSESFMSCSRSPNAYFEILKATPVGCLFLAASQISFATSRGTSVM